MAYAKYLDAAGEKARKAGQTLILHNHDWEFTKVYNGRTAYDIVMANTSKKNVTFQLDLYWAVQGGQDPVALLKQYRSRIQFFHVKDRRESDGRIEIVGRGHIDFPKHLRGLQGPDPLLHGRARPALRRRHVQPVRGGRGGLRVPRQREVLERQGPRPRHDRGKSHDRDDRDHGRGRGRGHDRGDD